VKRKFLSLLVLSLLLAGARVKNIRYYASQSYSRVVVDLSRYARYKTGKLIDANRVRFYIDISPAVLKVRKTKRHIKVNKGYLLAIRTAQFNKRTVRVVLDLKKNYKQCKVFTLPNPFRIVIDVLGKRGKLTARNLSHSNKNLSMLRQLGLKVRKIVLDPGHGGHDPGAISPVNGIREKDLVLDIAYRVKKLLESEGYEVYLTRNSDLYLPLEERTAFANGKQADLFVSIHINSSRKRRSKGISTYYLNFATDEEAERVAAKENEASSRSFSALEDLLEKIILNDKINESKALASSVQQSLVSHVRKKYPDLKNLGVKGAPFFVLIGAEMPAILVELSYLSHPIEARRLATIAYRQKLAEGLYLGLMNYVKSLEGQK